MYRQVWMHSYNMQAIVTDLLQSVPELHSHIDTLNDELDSISGILLEEITLLEHASLERNERQKKALLQKVNQILYTWILRW